MKARQNAVQLENFRFVESEFVQSGGAPSIETGEGSGPYSIVVMLKNRILNPVNKVSDDKTEINWVWAEKKEFVTTLKNMKAGFM